MKQIAQSRKALYQSLVLGVSLLTALLLLSSQFHIIGDSVRTIITADHGLFVWALVAAALSYLTAALTYIVLAVHRLKFWPTVFIQLADGFTNRVLPASIGGIATNFLYLLQQKHSKTQASFVVAADDSIGFIGHGLILLALVILANQQVGSIFTGHLPMRLLVAGAIMTGAITIYFAIAHYNKRLFVRSFETARGAIGYVLQRPVKLVLALVVSWATTTTYAAILYFSALAVNVHLSLLQIFIVLTIGVVSIAVTPTPGGIGGAEAGLTAGFVGMGVPPQQALSATLLYRAVTFWLPIIPGFFALQFLLRRGYIKIAKI